MLRAYDVLTHFRNLCAHDERLYCARVDNDTYATMLKLLEVALPANTVLDLKNNVEKLIDKYESDLQVITAEDLMEQLGLH